MSSRSTSQRLGIKEEKELIRQFRVGLRVQHKIAADAAFLSLADALMPLMASLSHKFCRRWPQIQHEEAMAAAFRGLWMAVNDWDSRFNVRLATRAFTKIRTQHRMLVEEERRFYKGGTSGSSGKLEIETKPMNGADEPVDQGTAATDKTIRNNKHTKRHQQLKQKLRKAISQLSDGQKASLLAAGLCSPLHGENKVMPPPSKWHLDKAVEVLKRVMLNGDKGSDKGSNKGKRGTDKPHG